MGVFRRAWWACLGGHGGRVLEGMVGVFRRA